MGFEHLHFSAETKDTVTRYLAPRRIVCAQGAKQAEALLLDLPRQVKIHNDPLCTLEEGGYVLLDLGSEIQGGIEILVDRVTDREGSKRGSLRLVFGESVSEALSTVGDGNNALNDHAVRDMTVETTAMSGMRYGNTGFRFVRILAVDCTVTLAGVKGVFEYRDIPYLGSFESDDERLNEIFRTAAYTVHLNMQDYIWDGIKRDRLVWVGDMHPEVSTIARVFGNDPSVRKTLDFARRSFPLDGDNPRWMIYPSYNCCWLMIQRDWYLQFGDLAYLNEQKQYVLLLCERLMQNVAKDGTLDFDGKFFVDWSSKDTPYMEAGFRGCLTGGLRAAKELAEIFGEERTARRLQETIDAVAKKKPPFDGNKQVCAMTALQGLCSEREALDILKTDPLQGLSTFYGYYVLRFLGETNQIPTALEILRGYWGAMLDLGATTFWEDFDIAWTENAARIDGPVPEGKRDVHAEYGKFCYQKLRHSLCHGWAGGPAAFLSQYVLGIQIGEAGCKTLRIEPQLGDLTHVTGTFPTPYGTVRVEHRREGTKILSRFSAPREITVLCDNETF